MTKIAIFRAKNRFFLLFLTVWILVFCGLRTVQHFSFGTNACDLSLFDYGISYTLRGELMSEPFHQFGFGQWVHEGGELRFERVRAGRWESHFTVHFTPLIFLAVPFYLVFNGPLFLLYLQVIFVGLSALMLYLIAGNILNKTGIAAAVGIVYLLFRHLLIGLMHDIHMEMYFPFFFFAAFYFLAVNRKPALYLMFLTLALFIKEDIAIYMAFFGLFAFFVLRERTYGLITVLYSAVYFGATMGFAIPHFRSAAGLKGSYAYEHIYGLPGQGLFQTAVDYLIHPSRFFQGIPLNILAQKFSNIVSPLLLLPFFSAASLLMIPPLAAALASKNPQIYSFGIHYSATLLPFVFISLVYGLNNIKNHFQRWESKKTGLAKKTVAGIIGLLVLVNLANTNFWRIANPSRYKNLKDYREVRDCIKMIPEEASVAALSALIPHLPKRIAIYMLPEWEDVEYVFIHTGINIWPYTREEFENFCRRMKSNKSYTVLKELGKITLFKKIPVPELP